MYVCSQVLGLAKLDEEPEVCHNLLTSLKVLEDKVADVLQVGRGLLDSLHCHQDVQIIQIVSSRCIHLESSYT